MTTNPVRLDRLQAGTMALIRSRAPSGTTAKWTKTKYPRGIASDTYFTAQLDNGPSPRADRNHAAVYEAVLPLELTLTVDGVLTAGDTLILCVSGRTFRADVEAGDTAEDLRDRLLSEFAEPMIDAVFSADGTDAMRIVAVAYGDLYGVRVLRGPASLSVDVSSLCKVQEDSVRCEVEIQAYSRSPDPMTGAHAALSRIVQTLELPEQAAILEDHGMTVAPANVVDLSKMAGPEWETRSAVTLSVYLPSVAASPINAVQSAGLTLEARDLPGTNTITVETS